MTGNHLASVLLAEGRRRPERPAVRSPQGAVLSYGDLLTASGRIAAALADTGVRPGDRVVAQVEKSVHALVLDLACLRSGAVLVPLNPAYRDVEVAALVADAEPALVVRDAGRDPLPGTRPAALTLDADGGGSLPEAAAGHAGEFDDVRRSREDPAAILYTSGTTGAPKGAVMSHGNLAANVVTLVEAWGFTADDVLLHVLPLFHTHGLFVAAHCVLAAGASMTLLPRFDAADVVRLLPRCTAMMGVPTHYTRLLAEVGFDRAATASVRLFTSGSAPMLVATHEQLRARTGRYVLERYGMTETCMLTSNPLDGERRPGTVGLPLPGVGLRIVGDDDREMPPGRVGEVQVRGATVFAGYWRRAPHAAPDFTPDGWFRTGDLGRLDGDGYLQLVGRSKDLVITGGLNVHPTEVEQVLDGLPGVAESAVVGQPDPDLGERVVAFVVAAPGARVEPERLRAAARERLASYKTPKAVVVVDELPRNVMGKVEKAVLRTRPVP